MTFCVGRSLLINNIDKFHGFPRQQKSFGGNPEKQLACEVGWGIANFCIKGLKAIGSPGKKIAAPAVFLDLSEGLLGSAHGPVRQGIRYIADDTVLVTFAKTKVTRPPRL
jgi:hypothetical protein